MANLAPLVVTSTGSRDQLQSGDTLLVGTGIRSVVGTLTLDAGGSNVNVASGSSLVALIGAGAVDFSAATGLFKTTTGAVTVGPGAVTVSGLTTFTAAGTALSVTNSASVGGALLVSGNLTVNGAVTSLNSAAVNIADRLVPVNFGTGANDPVPSAIAGLSVRRGAVAGVERDYAAVLWDESNSRFNLAFNTAGDDVTIGADLALKVGALTGTAGATIGGGAVALTGTAASSFTTSGSLTLTGGAASVWSTTAGTLTLNGFAGLNLQSAGMPMLSLIGSGATVQAGTTFGTTGTGNINLPQNASSRFQIEGVSTAATVTAANLATLTAGSGSNASSLHTHTGLTVFTSSAAGLVPASGGGTSNFLRADGTFAAPPGGGTPASTVVSSTVFGQASAVGSSLNYAREDHVHGTPNTVFTSGAVGLVPASGGGTANFLRADGTFAAPSGTAAVGGTGAVQFAVGTAFSGDGTNFFWDATNKRLGIGSATPTQPLEVAGQVFSNTGGFRFPDNSVQTTAVTALTPASSVVSSTTFGQASAVGSSTNYAREDHVHGTPSTVFTSGAIGLVPASGGGTTNFLRADGTFAVPPGTGGPGGTSGQFQFNNSGAFAGTADLFINTTNGFIGVGGQSSPAGVLDVLTPTTGDAGQPRFLSGSTTGGDENEVIFGAAFANYRAGVLRYQNGQGTAGNARIKLFHAGDGDTTGLQILGGGFVGIGQPTPTQALEVTGQIFSNTGGFRFPDNSVQTTAVTALTPASTVVSSTTFGQSSAVGSSLNYAREDHVHGTPSTVFTPSAVGLVPASGGGTVNFLRADGTFASPPGSGTVFADSPLTGNGSSGSHLGIQTASGSQAGALSSTDWTTFNNKENVLTFTAPLSRSVNTISIPAASASADGYVNQLAQSFAGNKTFTGNVSVNGNLLVSGTTSSIESTNVRLAINHFYLNAEYTSPVAQSGGVVVTYDPTATADTVAGAYTAGVASVSNPTVVTTGSATFAVGDLIQFSGSTSNSSLYEVLSHVGTTLTIRGVGTTPVVEAFTSNQFVSGPSDSATITKVGVSVARASVNGNWETGWGNSTPLSFAPIPAAATSVVSSTTFGQASAVGSATAYARADHVHGTPNTVFTSSAVGLVPASGGGTTSFLRADGTFAVPAGTGISGSGAANEVVTWNGTSTVTGSSTFTWNSGSSFLGVGTATPLTRIYAYDPTLVQITSASDANAQVQVMSGGGGAPAVVMYAARGTLASPTAVQSGDFIGEVDFGGQFDSTVGDVTSRTFIRGVATENWSSSAVGSRLDFFTTKNTTNTANRAMTIDQSGSVGIGTTTPSQPLQVAGQIFSSVGGFRFPDNSVQTTAAVTGTPASSVVSSTVFGQASAVGTSTNYAREDHVHGTPNTVFTSGAVGLVPASGGGTTNFLRADGTFAVPSGAGNVSGTGAANEIVTWSGTSTVTGTAAFTWNGSQLAVAPAATTSGSTTTVLVTGAANTNQTAGTEAVDVNFNLARTVQFATGALATQRAALFQAPTYAFVGASTLTSAATLAVSGSPIAGTNATITNAYSLWVQGGNTRFDGSVGIGTNPTASLTVAPAATTSGSTTTVLVTGAANTTQTASTEAVDINWNLARTVQFATGALTTQRAILAQAPTYAFVGASTLTNAATVAITGAPVAGTNATISNAYALWVQGGASRFDGLIQTTSGGVKFPDNTTQTTAFTGSGTVTTSAPATGNGSAGSPVSVSTFSSSASGVVPASGGGTVNFLRADGTWAAPSSGVTGSGTANHVTYWTGASTVGSDTGFTTDGAGNLTTGRVTVTPAVTTSGSTTTVLVTGAANTTQTASTEAVDVNFNLARTVQFATGALTTQRAALFQAPTYAFVGASTITNAATVAITGSPVAGTNATITNPYAFWVQGGNARFDGNVGLGVSPNSTFNSGGSMAYKVTTVTGNTTLDSTYHIVRVDATSGPVTITLPTAVGISGREYRIEKIDSGGNTVTVATTSSQTINGSTTQSLTSQYNEAIVVSNNANWDQLAVTAAGSTGYVQFNTGGSLNANSRLFWDNTNFFLGINQSSPSEMLHILVPSTQGGTGIKLQGAGNASPRYGLSCAHTGLIGQVGLIDNPGDFYTNTTFGDLLLDGGRIVFATNNSALRAVLDTSGNFGLGTNSPTAVLHVAPSAFTSGSHPSLVVAAPASTAQTASTELSDVNFNLARTLQFATGAITTQRAALVQAPTYAFVGASTITNAATLAVTGSPVAGTNATITNAYSLWVQGGTTRLDGALAVNNTATIAPTAVTSGTQTAVLVTGAANTGLTASTESPDVNLNLARTVQFATGALTTQRATLVQAPTYAFVGASTLTNAATVAITGAPVAGTNATITNAYSIWVQGGASRFDGLIQTTSGGIQFPDNSIQTTAAGSGNVSGTGAANEIVTWTGTNTVTGTSALTWNGSQLTVAGAATSSGSTTAFTLTGAANTNQTAGVEAPDVNLNLARTVQFATATTLTNQRAVLVQAPTYTAAGSSTITNATTFAVTGAPVAGTNMSITNPYAFWVQGGTTRFDGNISATGSVTVQPNANFNLTYNSSGVLQQTGVNGTGEVNLIVQSGTNTSDLAVISLQRGTGASGVLQAGPSVDTAFISLTDIASGTYGYLQSSHTSGIVLVNNDTNGRVYIAGDGGRIATFQGHTQGGTGNSAGGVGIGFNPATTPLERLRVDTGPYTIDGLRIDINSVNAFAVYRSNTGTTGGVVVNAGQSARDFQVVGTSLSTPAFMVQGSSNKVGIGTTSPSAFLTVAPSATTSGSTTTVLVTGAANTSQTASTEAVDVNFNLARTVQFATGALTTQRAILAQAPTYAFVGASTLTNAATMAITGSPVAGTNATITNAYSLWVQGGATALGGSVSKASATLTTTTTLDATYHTVRVDATSGNIVINLPTAASAFANGVGRIYIVKKIDSTANTVTVTPNGSDKIDGAASKVISTQYTAFTFQAAPTTTDWDIV